MLKLLYVFTWRFFRFLPSFCYIFWNLLFNCPWDLLWKKKLTAILRQGFCLSEKDCYKYWWMVVVFEWTLSSFLKLCTICSFWSLLEFLMVNHNGVFLVQNIWLGKGKFLLLCSFTGKLWDLCQVKLMLWSFFNPSWLDTWTFWLSFTLWVCQEACKITAR